MQKPTHHPIPADAPERLAECLECGSTALEERFDEETFEYGGREKPFTVTARIPSLLCTACGVRFYNDAAVWARHEAACRHLGVMTPDEIRALREGYGLTQEEFAGLTGLGVASLGRWERGAGIQNEGYDALLHLLSFSDNAERLRRRKQQQANPPTSPSTNQEFKPRVKSSLDSDKGNQGGLMSATLGKWPDRAIDKMQRAVDEWNRTYPERKPMRIAWGFANREEEAEEAKQPRPYRHAEALLDFCDGCYEIALSQSGDPDYPDNCHIDTSFSSWPNIRTDDAPILPLADVKRFYNLLHSCEHGVRLRLIPDCSSGAAIAVVGLSTWIAVETLSARILHDALSRLRTSTELVWGWLSKNEGDDWWSMDGGAVQPTQDDDSTSVPHEQDAAADKPCK
jgi:putative zinc finger/helix-turn-helix YgiT family protein